MDFTTYLQNFQNILDSPAPEKPYDNADYLDYTRLNWARQHRWLKTGMLNQELVHFIKRIDKKQYWIVIAEPWCGDAAHTIPFIDLLAQYNNLITVDYQLRDSEPFLIDQYLTNGAKSIPKLIIQDENHQDLAVWGPRPARCQLLYNQLTAEKMEFHEMKIILQKWYNDDRGVSFQAELLQIFRALNK